MGKGAGKMRAALGMAVLAALAAVAAVAVAVAVMVVAVMVVMVVVVLGQKYHRNQSGTLNIK